jgi:ferritin-like protein
MDRNDLLKKLQELAQVDIDIVHTYNRVLKEISDEIVHSRLTAFRDNHINHLTAIMEEIESIGGEPPKLTKDFKGYVIEAFAVLSTAAGMKSALKVLKAAETISYEYYGQIFSEDIPHILKERLRKYFSDEKIHLEYIDNNLKVL